MADSDVQVAPDSTGKLVDTASLTTGAGTVQRQRMILGDNTTAANYAVIDSSGRVAVVAVDSTGSGNITAQNSNPNSGAATAGSTVAMTGLNGKGTVTIGVQGTYTGALTPQVSIDGSNWVALNLIVNVNTGVYTATIASAAVGAWQADIAGCANFRISANAAVTGTATVTLEAAESTGMVALDAPIPAGTNVIGALSANQSVNVAQVSASAVSTSATGVQQVGVGYIVSTAIATAAAGVAKVGIVGNTNATIDAAINTALPTNGIAASNVPSSVSGAALSVKTLSAVATATNIKATAGNLYGFCISNTAAASVGFIQFFNTSTTTTTAPVLIVPVGSTAPGNLVYMFPASHAALNFSTGIAINVATTVAGTTELTVSGSVFYL